MAGRAWPQPDMMPVPARCSSPLLPESLLRQTQQRAGSAAGTLRESHSQTLQDSYSQPTRAGSPVAAPLRVSLKRLPVAGGKLVADKPTSPYTAPVDPLAASTRYSTDNLRVSSTPHGLKYSLSSRSADSCPLPAAGRSDSPAPVRTAAPAGIAAAWLGHQQQPSRSTDSHPLATTTDSSSSSRTLPSIHHFSMTPSTATNIASCPAQRQSVPQSLVPAQEDEAMDHVIKDPVSHLIQQAEAATAAATAAAAHALRQAAEAGSVSSSQGASSSSSSSSNKPGLQVFTRNKAIQLEADLQALPSGQLLTAQQQHTQTWTRQQQQHWERQLQLEPLLLQCYKQQQQQPVPQQQQQHNSLGLQLVAQQLLPWQQQTSGLVRELTEQVAYHCVEHGRTLEALQERNTELANALFMALTSLSQHHAALTATAQATNSALQSSRSQAADLLQQLSAQQASTQDALQQLATLTAQHEEMQEESQQSQQQLQQLVDSLKEQLWQARADLEQQAAAAQAAVAQEAALASTLLAEAEDEAADLRQRLAFVHAQLQAIKEQQRQEPDTACVAVQTEAEQQAMRLSAPDSTEPATESSEDSTDTEESLEDAPDIPKAINLLEYVSRGTKRSKLWVVKVLGQVTADKAVADAVADRQGIGRSSMKDFVPIWCLNRYGLQHLSDQVLGDMCASICHHAAAGLLPARWFACFCGLGPAVRPKKKQRQLGPWQLPGLGYSSAAGASSGRASPAGGMRKAFKGLGAAEAEVLLGSAAAADFWVFCACQLAYPNSVVALFPEAQEALPLVRSNLVMESIKAAFRWLGDSAGQAQFVAEKLDLAAVAADVAGAPGADAPLRASSSRPGTGSSVVGRFGFYNAWALLDLLLAEWLARAWGRARTMARLRREAASLQPCLQEQYAAAVAAASASDSPHGSLLDKMQEAYDVLQPLLDWPSEPLLAPDDVEAGEQDSSTQDHQQQQQQPGPTLPEQPTVSSPQQQQQQLGPISQEQQAVAVTQEQVAAHEAGAGSAAVSEHEQAEAAAAQLLQDAATADAEGAWRAYKLLVSLVQLVLPRDPDSAVDAEADAAAAEAVAPAATAAATAAEAKVPRGAESPVNRRPLYTPPTAEGQPAGSPGLVLIDKLQQKLASAGVTFAQGVNASGSYDASAAAAILAQQINQPGCLSSAVAAALEQRLMIK